MVVRKNVTGGVRDDRLTLDGEPWHPAYPGVGRGSGNTQCHLLCFFLNRLPLPEHTLHPAWPP